MEELNHGQTLLHERCQRILFKAYPDARPSAIVACCNEWVQKGHKIPSGVLKYFQVYFLDQ